MDSWRGGPYPHSLPLGHISVAKNNDNNFGLRRGNRVIFLSIHHVLTNNHVIKNCGRNPLFLAVEDERLRVFLEACFIRGLPGLVQIGTAIGSKIKVTRDPNLAMVGGA